ncbi:uncharacterized protein LOC143474585 [Brachyhypopomus gauderio]|uniref:uncharacterized protein LOC143474585 n=1 Tax=Brachyhypopomus gauderio TaxID=698409 RepID=UPI004041CE89
MIMFTLLLLSALTGTRAEDLITPNTEFVFAVEGQSVELSCKYSGTYNSLHWYRQYPGSPPQFLKLESYGQITEADPPVPGISIEHHKNLKKVDLNISSAAVSDSALYYCAFSGKMKNRRICIRNGVCSSVMAGVSGHWLLFLILAGYSSGEGIGPNSSTVNVLQGNPVTLSCQYNGSYATDSLLWYRQYSRSRPQFLYLVDEGKHELKADPPVPGVSAVVNEDKNRVDLQISSAAVSDSALYYCALQPTVTGNYDHLHKNI